MEEDRQTSSSTLKGIVVDAGHGGSDPGSSGNGIVEKDLTLEISKYMGQRFKELGIPVTLTRTTDITLTPEERVAIIMDAYGNDPNVIVISNHLNAGGGDIMCVSVLNIKLNLIFNQKKQND
jgi:N-acetylmuramoyl-L-alanine amidase